MHSQCIILLIFSDVYTLIIQLHLRKDYTFRLVLLLVKINQSNFELYIIFQSCINKNITVNYS